jgi:transposase
MNAQNNLENDYDDFITAVPDPVKVLQKEEMELALEHSLILRALGKQNMTAKEIHFLFWDPDEEEYSKTIKTIYRYLEALETEGLVKEAGHRKPKNSRLTEKLYCRTAIVFFARDRDEIPKWWTSAEGKSLFNKLGEVMKEYFALSNKDAKSLQKLLIEFYSTRSDILEQFLFNISENKELTELVRGHGIYEIKFIAGMIGFLGVIVKNHDLLTSLQNILSQN